MASTRWLCSLRRKAGRPRKKCEEDSCLCDNKPNVNEEYLEAFRTKSYMEIYSKAQGHLGKTSTTRRLSSSATPTATVIATSTSLPLCMHLTEFLLEPRQEIIENMKVHHLLVNYFEASLEACHLCDTILEGIHSMRLSYKRITRVVKLSKRVLLDCSNDHKDEITLPKDTISIQETDPSVTSLNREFSSLALQSNPLSFISTVQFRHIHDKYIDLLHSLKSKRGKIQRRLTWKRICKKVGGIALVTCHSAVLIALLIFSFHSLLGLVAAPTIVSGLVGLFMKRIKKDNREMKIKRSTSGEDSEERLCEQLDVAAKGVYILIKDLDTMSRMVKRLHDEVEHGKVIVDVCVRNGRKCEILKQVVRALHDNESSFLDQLEELEEHVYLCFLTINRSRRLVMQEIVEKKH